MKIFFFLLLLVSSTFAMLDRKELPATEKKAIAGDRVAQFEMALFFEPLFRDEAYNEFADLKKYMYWLEKSANNGDADAQWAIGQAYLGEDFPEIKPNLKLAISYISKAGKAGNPYAQSYMGDHLFRKKNIAEALKWYELAANQNLDDAQLKVIFFYFVLDFKATPTNIDKAKYWISRLDKNPYYEETRGLLSLNKEFIRDLKKYPKGILTHAKQGDKNAQWLVAKYLPSARWIWVPNDWIEKYAFAREVFWLKKAEAQGQKDALAELKNMRILYGEI
jgi:TPR repeat protein